MSDQQAVQKAPSTLPVWVVPLGFAVVAFLFRLFLGHLYTEYGGDAPGYTAIARNLAAAHGYSVAHTAPYPATDIRVPGYPALLAVAFAVSGSHRSVIVLNALLGGITTYLVWLLADGLRLSRAQALWCTGIAAVWLSTASFAGTALSENLSVPAVLALVTFVLVRPPRSNLRLFIVGSLLAWVTALTRDELVVFVVVIAIIAGRRAHLRALGTTGLALCFLLGSFAWAARNEIQVHRIEYVDPVMTEAVIAASLNGSLHTKVYKEAGRLVAQPSISAAQRAQYTHRFDTYVKHELEHELPAVLTNKAKYLLESFFPVPIFGLTYVSNNKFLVRFAWSFMVLIEYFLVLATARRWWRAGRKKDLVSVFVFPVFIVCIEVMFDPQFRFWLPANLLLLPLAVECLGTALQSLRRKGPSGAGAIAVDQRADPPSGAVGSGSDDAGDAAPEGAARQPSR